MEMRTLTNQILRELIDRIDVYGVLGKGKNRTQRLVICYKFVDYLAIPESFSAPNYRADLRQGVAVEYVSPNLFCGGIISRNPIFLKKGTKRWM